MTDFAEVVALAEERSYAQEDQELIDEHRAPQCTDEVWRFPVSEGEKQQ